MNTNETVFTKIAELQKNGKFEEVYGPDVLRQVLSEDIINKGAIKKIFIALLKRDNIRYTVDLQQYWLRNEKSYKEMGDTITGNMQNDLVYKYYFYECGCIVGEKECENAKAVVLRQMGTDVKSYIEGTDKQIFGRSEEVTLDGLLLIHDVFVNQITEDSCEASLPLEQFREKIDARKDVFEEKKEERKDGEREKRGLSDKLLHSFPDVVRYVPEENVVRYDGKAYEKKRKDLLSDSLYYVLRELKNKGKYFHALHAEYLNLAREKKNKGVWEAIFEAILLRDKKDLNDNVLLRTGGTEEVSEILLPDRKRLQSAVEKLGGASYKNNASFAALGEELKASPLIRFYMLQCGLIAGTEEDRKKCLDGIEAMLKEDTLKEYHAYMKYSLDVHFLRLCTAEQVQDYIAGQNNATLDDAMRALLYALTNTSELFRQTMKDKNLESIWEEGQFSNKEYLSERYFGNLLWTFEYMVREETVDVIDRCGRFLQRLAALFPDTGLKRIRYEELLRNTIKGQKKETILENCILDFENVDAWDGFTKFYHSIDDNRMRDAGNMYELIRYPYTRVVQQSVLTNVQRSLERTVMGALPANFLENSLFFLKWAELPGERNRDDVKAMNGYWNEFVNQMNRHRFMADLDTDKGKKEKVEQFFAYACKALKENQKFPYSYIGTIVYTVLEQNRELLCEFWEKFFRYEEGMDCPFVRFLLAKNDDGNYRYSRQLFRFLMQSFIMIKNERDEKKKELLKSCYVRFFKTCNVDGFVGQKHVKGRKAGREDDYSRVIRVLAEFVEEKEVKRGIKKELLYAIVEDYPSPLKNASSVVFELYRYQYSKEYLDAIEYVHNFYEGIFQVQEDLYLNLKRCLGYLMGSESRDRGMDTDDLRARVMDLLLKTGWNCCVCSGRNTEKKFTDMMRFAKDMYALAELCTKEQLEALGTGKEEIKRTVNGLIEDTASLENYDKALFALLSCGKMANEIKTDVICYGLTNHWDPFVEAVGNGVYESALVDVDVFDRYLRQIDYRKFRRSALQKIIRDLNGEDEDLSMLEKRIIADNYVNSLVKFIGPDETSLTRVLYDAVVELKMAKKELLDSVSGLVLNRKYREWSNLENAVAFFYEGSEADTGEESKLTKVLSLLIKNSYYPEDIIKLLHSMACRKDKAVYAKYLLDSGAFHPVITRYRVNYYKTICNAVLGNSEDAECAYEACTAYSNIPEAQEENSLADEVFMDKDFVSRCNKKLEEHIMSKIRSGKEVMPDERMMRMNLEPANLFKFGFMSPVKPQKNEVFETNKVKFFKKDTVVSEKCMCARYLYYWLVYGGYELENYADFLVEWALCETKIAKENEKFDFAGKLYEEFSREQERKEDSVFASKAEQYERQLKELFYGCMAEAGVEIPRKLFDGKKLNANNVKIGGKLLKELLEGELFQPFFEKEKNGFGGVLYEINRLLSNEEELSDRLDAWLTERDEEEKTTETRFLENFRKELKKRMNGDLEFTVLNKDEDAMSLFFRVKNICGEDIEWLYMSVRGQDGTELAVYKIEDLEKDGVCYGEAGVPEGVEYDTCEVVFYTELDEPETSVLSKYNKESWMRSAGPSYGAQTRDVRKESPQSVENTVRGIIKDKKDKWLRLDKPYKAEDFVEVINRQSGGKARAIKVALAEGESITEDSLVQKIKGVPGEAVKGNDLSDLRLERGIPLWVFCMAEDVDALEDIYTRRNRQIRFVFCGKEWTKPENEGWEKSLSVVTVESTFTEQMELTRDREAYYFLDETLECMGALGLSVEEATQSIDELCEKYEEAGRIRNNVYPSDLSALKGVTVPMAKVLEEKNSVKEVTALTLRRMPENPEDRETFLKAIVKASNYETEEDIARLFGIQRNYNDYRGAQIIGKQKNTQINNFVNVFNIYKGVDLEELRKAEAALADAEEKLADTEDRLTDAEEKLKNFKEDLETKEKEAADLWNELNELEQRHDAESAETKQRIEALQKQAESTDAEASELRAQAEAKEAEAQNLREQVQAKEAETQSLREQVQAKDAEISQKEAEAEEKIKDAAKAHREQFKLTIGEMATELFGANAAKVTELLPYMAKETAHQQAFENAIFVHYLFAKILEDMRGSTTNGSSGRTLGDLDYAPVNLMYAKLYEALLKSYHVDVYGQYIGAPGVDASGNPVAGRDTWEIKVGNTIKYFNTLSSGDKTILTIGSFSSPIWRLEPAKQLRRYYYVLKNGNSRVSNYWDKHKDRIDVIREYRNGCAHSGDGQTTTGEIVKADVDELTRQLFKLEGYKMIFKIAEVQPNT